MELLRGLGGVRSSFGNVSVRQDRGGRYISGAIRKTYTRHTPPVKYGEKKKIRPREKASIIMLRKLGYPINMISKAFNRSTSFVHKVLQIAKLRRSIHFIDMRKLASSTRQYCSRIRWNNLQRFMAGWIAFIKGEVDKPP